MLISFTAYVLILCTRNHKIPCHSDEAGRVSIIFFDEYSGFLKNPPLRICICRCNT